MSTTQRMQSPAWYDTSFQDASYYGDKKTVDLRACRGTLH